MPRMTMIEAIRNAMDVSMGHDASVVVFGEDVGYFGGVFRCTAGLQQKYGASRCVDSPKMRSAMLASPSSARFVSTTRSGTACVTIRTASI
jgi:2-oxoisovalerate dehydrogenase E1 component beta subunit